MGTNYYLRSNVCIHCGHFKEIHLGKCSCGWRFLFHKCEEIKNISDVQFLVLRNKIYNEYGDYISTNEFWDIVKSHQNEQQNTEYCETIDGYDFYEGDFS